MRDPAHPPVSGSLSTILAGLAQVPVERISFADLSAALADRGYAALLVFFAAPNLLPLPPGSSTVFGIPLIFVACQLLIGRQRVWLPPFLRRRSIDHATYRRIAERIAALLKRVEVLARPRLWPRPATLADRMVGLLALAMGLVLVLPIPFGNLIPALAVLLAAMALAERDGLWLGASLALAAIGLAIIAGVLGVLESTASWLAA